MPQKKNLVNGLFLLWRRFLVILLHGMRHRARSRILKSKTDIKPSINKAMEDVVTEDYKLYFGDCLKRMSEVPDASVELILCDPPFGTTACAWDSIIPLDQMWEHYRRIITSTGAIVMFAAQPFTSVLAVSNLHWFKYTWVWEKNRPTNFAHARNKPMRKSEDILVFSPGTTVHKSQSKTRMTYNPQGVTEVAAKKVTKRASEKTDTFFSDRPSHREFTRNQTGFPHNILRYSTEQLGLHPTAKPVPLLEYLINTYSFEGETVMDNCLGSGSTGIAAMKTGRKFIGIEQEEKYFSMSVERISSEKYNAASAI